MDHDLALMKCKGLFSFRFDHSGGSNLSASANECDRLIIGGTTGHRSLVVGSRFKNSTCVGSNHLEIGFKWSGRGSTKTYYVGQDVLIVLCALPAQH